LCVAALWPITNLSRAEALDFALFALFLVFVSYRRLRLLGFRALRNSALFGIQRSLELSALGIQSEIKPGRHSLRTSIDAKHLVLHLSLEQSVTA